MKDPIQLQDTRHKTQDTALSCLRFSHFNHKQIVTFPSLHYDATPC